MACAGCGLFTDRPRQREVLDLDGVPVPIPAQQSVCHAFSTAMASGDIAASVVTENRAIRTHQRVCGDLATGTRPE